MDATFFAKIKSDYPEFVFKSGKRFVFRPPKTILINFNAPSWEILTLHELGHALLNHRDYKTGVERLKMERDAWEKARELAEKYNIEFDENLAQEELDSYRNWLDKKARCPRCGLARYQDDAGEYHCPRCENFI